MNTTLIILVILALSACSIVVTEKETRSSRVLFKQGELVEIDGSWQGISSYECNSSHKACSIRHLTAGQGFNG
ncbi:MAG: hypothetical protein QQN63_00010 [Nitrosopumilus sp.]